MTKTLNLLSALALSALVAAPVPAAAQTVCGERDKIISNLSAQFSEVPVAHGLASNGTMIEIFAANSGTFTMLITRPSGHACMAAVGSHWELLSLPEKPKAEELEG